MQISTTPKNSSARDESNAPFSTSCKYVQTAVSGKAIIEL